MREDCSNTYEKSAEKVVSLDRFFIRLFLSEFSDKNLKDENRSRPQFSANPVNGFVGGLAAG